MPELEAVDGVAIVPVRNRGGRPKGSKNRITRDLKIAAGKYTLRSLRVLWKLASESPEPMIRLKAACELLDRAHGKPSQVQLIGGTGQPIQSQQLTVEISQRIASVFGQVATVDPDKSVAETLDDQSLRVVSAISYLQASAEAAQSPREPAGSSASANGVSAAAAPAVTPAAPEVPPEVIDVTPEPEEPEAPAVGHTLTFLESDLCIIGCPPDRDGLPMVFELRNHSRLLSRGPFNVVLEKVRKQSSGDLGSWVLQKPRPTIEPTWPAQRRRPAPILRGG